MASDDDDGLVDCFKFFTGFELFEEETYVLSDGLGREVVDGLLFRKGLTHAVWNSKILLRDD